MGNQPRKKPYKTPYDFTRLVNYQVEVRENGMALKSVKLKQDRISKKTFFGNMRRLGWNAKGTIEYPNLTLRTWACNHCPSIVNVSVTCDDPMVKDTEYINRPCFDLLDERTGNRDTLQEDLLDHTRCADGAQSAGVEIEVVDNVFSTEKGINDAGWVKRSIGTYNNIVTWECKQCKSKLRVQMDDSGKNVKSIRYSPTDSNRSHLDHKKHLSTKPRSYTVLNRTLTVVSSQHTSEVREMMVKNVSTGVIRTYLAKLGYPHVTISNCLKTQRKKVKSVDSRERISDVLKLKTSSHPFTSENRTRPHEAMYNFILDDSGERDFLAVIMSTYTLVHQFVKHASVGSVDGTFFVKLPGGVFRRVSSRCWQVLIIGFLNPYQMFVPCFYIIMSTKESVAYKRVVDELLDNACLSVTGFKLGDILDTMVHDNEAALYLAFLTCAVGRINHVNCRVHVYKNTTARENIYESSVLFNRELRDFFIKSSTGLSLVDFVGFKNDVKNMINDSEAYEKVEEYYLVEDRDTWLWCRMEFVQGIASPAPTNMSHEAANKDQVQGVFSKYERNILDIFKGMECDLLPMLSERYGLSHIQPMHATDYGLGDYKRGWLFTHSFVNGLLNTSTVKTRFRDVKRKARQLLRENPVVGIASDSEKNHLFDHDYTDRLLKSVHRNRAWELHYTQMETEGQCDMGILEFRKNRAKEYSKLALDAQTCLTMVSQYPPRSLPCECKLSDARPRDVIKIRHNRCYDGDDYYVFPYGLNTFGCTCAYYRDHNLCEHSQAREFLGMGKGEVKTEEDVVGECIEIVSVYDFFRDKGNMDKYISLFQMDSIPHIVADELSLKEEPVTWNDVSWRHVLDGGDNYTLSEFLQKKHAYHHSSAKDLKEMKDRAKQREKIMSNCQRAFSEVKKVYGGKYSEYEKLVFTRYNDQVCKECGRNLARLPNNVWNGAHCSTTCKHYISKCYKCKGEHGSHLEHCDDAPVCETVVNPHECELKNLRQYVSKMEIVRKETCYW